MGTDKGNVTDTTQTLDDTATTQIDSTIRDKRFEDLKTRSTRKPGIKAALAEGDITREIIRVFLSRDGAPSSGPRLDPFGIQAAERRARVVQRSEMKARKIRQSKKASSIEPRLKTFLGGALALFITPSPNTPDAHKKANDPLAWMKIPQEVLEGTQTRFFCLETQSS